MHPCLRRILFVVTILAGCSTLAWADHHEAVDFDPLRQAFEEGWKSGDAEALALLYTESALRVDGRGAVQHGRDAIEAALAAALSGPLAGTTISIAMGGHQALAGGLHVVEGTFAISGIRGPDGSPAGDSKGAFLLTVEPAGASWRIAASAVFSPTPAAGD